jgi:hypothetical protein
LLLPVLRSGDPEVAWRLSEVYSAQARPSEAEERRLAAGAAFERLLGRHVLAFADHAAEFQLAAGDAKRAQRLAGMNLDNRPTLRAFELAHAAAVAASDVTAGADLLRRAQGRWGHLPAFRHSPLTAAILEPALSP